MFTTPTKIEKLHNNLYVMMSYLAKLYV